MPDERESKERGITSLVGVEVMTTAHAVSVFLLLPGSNRDNQ
jgi:hypothetical protein